MLLAWGTRWTQRRPSPAGPLYSGLVAAVMSDDLDLREMKRPRCKACGANMMLIRRTPDPDHGTGHELRTFMCHKCKRERTVPTVLTGNKTTYPSARHR
jgi:hypothetical protein